ncbi:hypothetical protein [Pseudomonas aeruginosa]|uniref:hypothetical protein n=1 Tax=Pseudomonas aeruginosa TaxID=287 RepID=UPI001F17F69B|nr:hypothetical protein [Pseudomonas aeruginosa]MDP5678628.1 hypothetical protein [Pseudomonas aeruginosa]UTQ16843.1 hypothetical protein MUG61_11450 [Pseudomonas aeruginosa]
MDKKLEQVLQLNSCREHWIQAESACTPGSKKTLKFGPIYQSAEVEKLIFMPKMKEARHPWSLRSSA